MFARRFPAASASFIMGLMDTVEAGGASVAEGLEQLRTAHRLQLSRTLHDEIGPSLCSAGLMLGLVRSSSAALDPTSADMLDSIQAALENAISSVRALSYAADPGLAARCGFRSAMDSIARSHAASIIVADDAREFSGAASETACRIVQDVLIALSGTAGPARIECGSSGITLFAAGRIPHAPLSALSHLASTAGLTLACTECSEGTVLTLAHKEEA